MPTEERCTTCWVCGCSRFTLVRPSSVDRDLDAGHFQITDKNYGQTLAIYRCHSCGFMQCHDIENTLAFYEEMEDESYEQGRSQRLMQARTLLSYLATYKSSGHLLDVGAGTGILVEEALKMRFDAQGIEPSDALTSVAEEHGLPVLKGVLPHSSARADYDVVTLIDIIEHVTDPRSLLEQIVAVMSDEAYCMIVTPNVNSIAARVMGARWWHFRIAHVGYFNQKTLAILIDKAGLEIVTTSSPGWYFPANYLLERLFSYLPQWLRPPIPRFLEKLTVPLNLYDSLCVICRKKSGPASSPMPDLKSSGC
jgi:2-polyprenyl-3-methyl-5-hydroxy-6-metoxy-1,4-benzoquinol methylase